MGADRALNDRDQAFAVADLSDLSGPDPNPGWRGYVDEWSPLRGIVGWAFEVGGLRQDASVEFWIGDVLVGSTFASLSRDDVAEAAGASLAPGFVFTPDCFERASFLEPELLECRPIVRVSGGGPVLHSGEAPASGNVLVSDWQHHLLDGLSSGGLPRSEPGRHLLSRLGSHRGEAHRTAELPLAPIARNEIGRIESLCVTPSGRTWFVGWMKRSVDRELPAVIVDRQKFPSGLATVAYERSDLSTDSVGVIGLIDSMWVPAPRSSEFFVYVGADGQQHLRAGGDMRVLQWQVLRELLVGARTTLAPGADDTLLGSAALDDVWEHGNAQVAGIEAHASVDRAIVVPGFGCLAEGWIISPARRVHSMELKIGESVLVSDARATYFRPRPDLQHLAGGGSVTARSGFVAAFLGELPSDAAGSVTLRAVYDDGLATAHAIDAKPLRIVDWIADSEDVMRMFPSLGDEPFIDDLYTAAQRCLRARSTEPIAVQYTPGERVLVFQCSERRDQRFLLFDELKNTATSLISGDIGIAMVVGRDTALAEIKRQAAELSRAKPKLKISLFVSGDIHAALDVLPFVLRRLGARQFVFLGNGLIPTSDGWTTIASWLRERQTIMTFLEVLDDRGRADGVHGSITASAWGWNAAAFLAWVSRSPRFVRGTYKDNGLLGGAGRNYTLSRAAVMRIDRPVVAELADVLDERALMNATVI